MLNQAQQEMVDFIGVGGKQPEQLEERFGSGYRGLLDGLIAERYVREEWIRLQETGATSRAGQPEGALSYRLTDEGILARRGD
jgi:hypothetical protein